MYMQCIQHNLYFIDLNFQDLSSVFENLIKVNFIFIVLIIRQHEKLELII